MYDSVTQPCKNLSKNCTNYNHVLSRRIGWKWNTAEMTDSTSEKARVRHTIILVDRQTDRQTEESEAWQEFHVVHKLIGLQLNSAV